MTKEFLLHKYKEKESPPHIQARLVPIYRNCLCPTQKPALRKSKRPFILPTHRQLVENSNISPFSSKKPLKYADNQLNIKLNIGKQENVEVIKKIVAIKSLIGKNMLVSAMSKRLSDTVNGFRNPAGVVVPGIKYRIAMWVQNIAEAELNGEKISIKSTLGKDFNNLSEIISELKEKLFDKLFNAEFPEHPKYAETLSSNNIVSTLTHISQEVSNGNFRALSLLSKNFLNTLNLLNENGDPDVSSNKITQIILTTVNAKNGKVVDIKIVKLSKDKLANELFNQNETFEQIRKSFFDVLNDLEKQKSDEPRFKID